MHAPCESASDRAGLRAAAGRLVLEFTPAETFGDPTPRAESAAIPSGADPLAAASAIVTQLPGWRLSTADEELAEALTALGATVTRQLTRNGFEVMAQIGMAEAGGLGFQSRTARELDIGYLGLRARLHRLLASWNR